jgi:four helix bundle protein
MCVRNSQPPPAIPCTAATAAQAYRGRVNDFRRLVVWQRAHEATLETYKVTSTFPTSERFGLVSQMRRAAASSAANIAESCGRGTARDEARFLYVAAGSARELEYHALLARDLGYLAPEAYEHLRGLAVEVQCMLAALVRRVPRRPS